MKAIEGGRTRPFILLQALASVFSRGFCCNAICAGPSTCRRRRNHNPQTNADPSTSALADWGCLELRWLPPQSPQLKRRVFLVVSEHAATRDLDGLVVGRVARPPCLLQQGRLARKAEFRRDRGRRGGHSTNASPSSITRAQLDPKLDERGVVEASPSRNLPSCWPVLATVPLRLGSFDGGVWRDFRNAGCRPPPRTWHQARTPEAVNNLRSCGGSDRGSGRCGLGPA